MFKMAKSIHNLRYSSLFIHPFQKVGLSGAKSSYFVYENICNPTVGRKWVTYKVFVGNVWISVYRHLKNVFWLLSYFANS